MKTIINRLSIFVLMIVILSCKDESLDPFRINDLKKGSILALRGDAFDNLNDSGCSNSFFFNKIVGNEMFSFDADFLSEDPNSLERVDVYASNDGGPRVLIVSVPGSEFQVPTDGKYPQGTISFTLDELLNKLGIADPGTIGPNDLVIESDLFLKDGSAVPSGSVVNSGLFESGIFYPAQSLGYCAQDVNDFRPVPTLTLGKNVPLKATKTDTVKVEFDQMMETLPTITLNPGNGTLGSVVKVSDTEFYALYTAPAGFTGTVYAVVEGAVSGEEGALNGLEQFVDSIGISVDNTPAQAISLSTGTRIGRGQFSIITVTFNEAMNAKDTLRISVSGQNLDPITNAKMTMAADGLSASYVYNYKDSDNPSDATHGPLSISITGGSDKAGNAFGGTAGNLTNDIGTPPAPTVVLAGDYDLGTQIKWTINQSTGGSNPGGSTTGTVFYVAVPSGSTGPAQATTTVDGVVVNNGFDLTGVDVRQQGSVNVTSGTSGVVFTPFAANGDLDIYLYFVSNTGNVSPITAPVSVTMN